MYDSCVVVIVTYNSQKHIQWALEGLESSINKLTVMIVDSGSTETSYLDFLTTKHKLIIEKQDNVGFVAGNNFAIEKSYKAKWILLLNPDARIEGSDLDKLLAIAENKQNKNIALFSVPLVRFDINAMKPLGVYDSLGIRCNSYGKWYDIGANNSVKCNRSDLHKIKVDAVCGAFMLLRYKALAQSPDKLGKIGFESSYYMYKEDIELSLRLQKNNWDIKLIESLNAYHCRGWNPSRIKIPYWARYHSAKNDIDVSIRYKIRALPYALAKYLWVRFFERK
ncbi:MAG: glycosyltransferase [Klebsiella grimontii]|uniref:glycosyltransferase n=1 Tax=Klebsiella grimontii TaxID=2058152 RepID=UPI0015EA46F2|nr:glycosyltransferase [Klebsiella grimontii]MDU7346324.1 glycosyltransferase [Klebsiella grimontii]QLU76507.1 glycosyltransferase [Klebsiella grimontii]